MMMMRWALCHDREFKEQISAIVEIMLVKQKVLSLILYADRKELESQVELAYYISEKTFAEMG